MSEDGSKRKGSRHSGTGIVESRLVSYKAIVSIDRSGVSDDSTEWIKRGIALAQSGDLEGACRYFETAVQLQPGSPDALNNLGIALQLLGKSVEATARYSEALLANPNFTHARLNLSSLKSALGFHQQALETLEAGPSQDAEIFNLKAEIFGRLGQWTSSLAACDLSLNQNPEQSKTLHLRAIALKGLNRIEEALSAFEGAEATNPPNLEAIITDRAWLLAELGRRDAARAAFDESIRINPNSTSAWGHRSYLSRQVNPEDLATMERLLARPESSREDRMNLSFALGQAYLNLGEGELAFNHLQEGNLLKRSTISYKPDAEERRASEIRSVFTKEMLAKFSGNGNPSTQPIFVFGMPRSGTTLVEQILATHPYVFGGGEPTFLCDALTEAGANGEISRLGRRYLELVAEVAPEAERFVDKMPWNFLHAGLISLILPNARMIHVRRDALDTCVSCYSTLFTRGQEFTYDLAELGRYYRMYDLQMAHWRRVLSPNRFIEVDYATLVTHTEPEIRKLLEFCDLPWDADCLKFYETRRRVTSASLDQVRSPIYQTSLGRGQLLRPWLGDLEKELSLLRACVS